MPYFVAEGAQSTTQCIIRIKWKDIVLEKPVIINNILTNYIA